jgi:rare lipoprotein A
MNHMTSKWNTVTILALFAVLLAACSESRTEARDETGEKGIASWYGHPYHGRKTASGQIYDMEQMTAAHRLLPFGSVVRVTRVSNGKTVEVRINDRGPFVKGRIIDLSHAAATQLDIDGIAEVSLVTVFTPKTRGESVFAVQVGVFESQEEADRLRKTMAEKYGAARLVLRDGDPQTWRVVVGSESTVELAESLGEKLRAETGAETFVVAFDNE